MATLRENYEMEIIRRQTMNDVIQKATVDKAAAIAQFEELEAQYKTEIDKSRVKLESAYKENKHYVADWALVYDVARIEVYPYFNENDDLCNPYFPISLIKSGVEKGLSPAESLVSRTTGGPNARAQVHSPKEDVPRAAANTQLLAYPNTSNETPYGAPYAPPTSYPTSATVDTCYYGQGGELNALTCNANGGIWVEAGDPIPDPPAWSNTAPEILATALNSWKADIQLIVADIDTTHTQVYNNPIVGSDRTASQWWQDVIDEIDVCISLLPTSSFIGNPTLDWGRTQAPTGALLDSINNLKAYATTHIATFINSRSNHLQLTLDTHEEAFFGIIRLRLHQVNGSYSKLITAKRQIEDNAEITADNLSAIESIKKLITLL